MGLLADSCDVKALLHSFSGAPRLEPSWGFFEKVDKKSTFVDFFGAFSGPAGQGRHYGSVKQTPQN